MSDIRIYYSYARSYTKLQQNGVDLDAVLTRGDKDIYNEVRADPTFCRKEESISYTHMLSLIQSDITIYAEIDGRVAGVLCFMFNRNMTGQRFFNFNGICSPERYANLGIGAQLIHTLIRIAKASNIHAIYLDCKGPVKNYYERFGFKLINTKMMYDSDDSDDEGEPHYYMRLDLSQTTGGKRRRPNRTKQNRYKKKKRITRKRKLRKN